MASELDGGRVSTKAEVNGHEVDMPETDAEWSDYWQRTWQRAQYRLDRAEQALDDVIDDPWHSARIAHDALADLERTRRQHEAQRWTPRS